ATASASIYGGTVVAFARCVPETQTQERFHGPIDPRLRLLGRHRPRPSYGPVRPAHLPRRPLADRLGWLVVLRARGAGVARLGLLPLPPFRGRGLGLSPPLCRNPGLGALGGRARWLGPGAPSRRAHGRAGSRPPRHSRPAQPARGAA